MISNYIFLELEQIIIIWLITNLTGRSADHPLVQEVLKQYFPYEVYMNETTGDNNTRTCIDTHLQIHMYT